MDFEKNRPSGKTKRKRTIAQLLKAIESVWTNLSSFEFFLYFLSHILNKFFWTMSHSPYPLNSREFQIMKIMSAENQLHQ